MTLSPTERKIVVGLELEKANSIFSQIEVLQNAGFWDNIANRLYYSLFHAVSALLINEGLFVDAGLCEATPEECSVVCEP